MKFDVLSTVRTPFVSDSLARLCSVLMVLAAAVLGVVFWMNMAPTASAFVDGGDIVCDVFNELDEYDVPPGPCDDEGSELVDTDEDGIPDDSDNCPLVANPGQEDADNDTIGDVCDDDSGTDNDADNDGVVDDDDNCVNTPNPNQEDADNDGIGDACEDDTGGNENDADNDGVVDGDDNCVDTPNPNQEDADNDGTGDACEDDDNGNGGNPGGGGGDFDADNDGIEDDVDNCPETFNPGQADSDNDGIGDVCDDTDDSTSNTGGGSSTTSGGGGGTIVGLIGATTTPTTTTVTIDTGVCPVWLTGYIRRGTQNDPQEVLKLQQFLRDEEGFAVEVTGVYDEATYNAVLVFQRKYAGDILAPWGVSEPTGYVYYTTQKKINELHCKNERDFALTQAQQAEIQRVRTQLAQQSQQTGGGAQGGTAPAGASGDAETTENGSVLDENQTELIDPATQVGAAGEAETQGFWGRLWDRVRSWFTQ